MLYEAKAKAMLSTETSYSHARAHLATLLDEVHDNRQVVVIKRRNDKNVALIAEDELSSLLESVYLLRSPENAKRLFRALDWAQTATGHEDSLEALQAELSGESQASP
jgi:antitoxin YefM